MDHSHHSHTELQGSHSHSNFNNISQNLATNNDHSQHLMSGHAMAFHGGYNQILFFNSWEINSPMTMVYACLGIFIFSVLYEGFKVFREYLISHPPFAQANFPWAKKFYTVKHKHGCCGNGINQSTISYKTDFIDDGQSQHSNTQSINASNLLPAADSELGQQLNALQTFKSCDCKRRPYFSLPDHTLQSFLHIIQTTWGFVLMLVFMTFNVYLCLALVLGAGFGYFAFAWHRRIAIVDVTQHCN